MHLKHLVRQALADAFQHKARWSPPQTMRSGLRIEFKIEGLKTYVQLSHPERTPTDSELLLVIIALPYPRPIQAKQAPTLERGRWVLRANWTTPSRLVPDDTLTEKAG